MIIQLKKMVQAAKIVYAMPGIRLFFPARILPRLSTMIYLNFSTWISTLQHNCNTLGEMQHSRSANCRCICDYPDNLECDPDAMQLMMDYPWPGNVCELPNAVEHCMILARNGRVKSSALPYATTGPAATCIVRIKALSEEVHYQFVCSGRHTGMNKVRPGTG
ncbi:MAG: hypothetical protein BMS9Abin06_0659 [Gammaproteobacteria bacterium]|nr:MAG: hypothetical protein BMS9Abin06_0659 [Gammaproteobacteria bacterium]